MKKATPQNPIYKPKKFQPQFLKFFCNAKKQTLKIESIHEYDTHKETYINFCNLECTNIPNITPNIFISKAIYAKYPFRFPNFEKFRDKYTIETILKLMYIPQKANPNNSL